MRLQRSRYRLKDAGRVRNKLLFNTLNQHGLTEMEAAHCLFVRKRMMILFYVDDLFLFAELESLIENMKQKLGSAFLLKDLGIPRRFLGMDLKRHSDDSLSISETQLINKLLMDTGMGETNPLGSPIDQSSVVNTNDKTTLSSDQYATYRCIIQSLMHLATRARRDLSVTAIMLSSHLW